MFDHRHYVPVLRNLDVPTRAGMTPLIEVNPRALAAEEAADPAVVDKRCSRVAAEILGDWGDGRVFLDLRLIAPGVRAAGDVLPLTKIFQEGRTLFPSFVPVTAYSSSRGPNR